jgi:hypothetical protein
MTQPLANFNFNFKILLDWFTDLSSFSEDPTVHHIPTPDLPLSLPLISRPMPPLVVFNTDMNTNSTNNLQEILTLAM